MGPIAGIPLAGKVVLVSLALTLLGLLVLLSEWLASLPVFEYRMVDCRLPELNPPGSQTWDARCRCSDLDRMWEEQGILTSQTGTDICWDGTPLSDKEIEARLRPWGITKQMPRPQPRLGGRHDG